MIARILAILGLLLTPVAIFAPSPAAAQMDGSLGCSSSSSFNERWRTRRYYGTDQGQEYQNTCQYPIKFYYCVSYDPNPESCTSVSQFNYVLLQPGRSQRVYPTARSTTQYVHNIQCYQDDVLVDWRSQFTQAKGPRCKSPMPANVDRSPFPGSGTPPAPGAPLATLRGTPTVLLNRLEYPQSLIGTLAEGRTVAMIAVDVTGRATGCKITSSSGFFLFDKGTCDLFAGRYARYTAATDASGAPVPGAYEAKVVWTSP